MRLIGRIVCLFRGHRRGVRAPAKDTKTDFGRITTHEAYECPRCGRETRYRYKARKPQPGNNGAPSDGSESFRSAM